MKIIAYNKVLAEFMEVVKNKHTGKYLLNTAGIDWVDSINYFTWDNLIPVWIKFRDLEFTGKNEMEHSKVKHDLFHKLYRAKSPSDFFHHIVEAVKWYNQTKTK